MFVSANDQVSYQYVEVNGTVGESRNADSQGVGVNGSFELGELFYVTAGYLVSDIDTRPESDAEFYRLGVGVHEAISDSVDSVAMVHYGGLDANLPLVGGRSANFQESGALAELGIRGRLSGAWEYTGLITYVDWGNRGLGYRVGGRYRLGQSPLSLGVHYTHYESAWERWEVGVRYRFD